MKVDILNCDKWVQDNQIPEVKNGNLMSSKSTEPDPEGLVSYEIFGRPGSLERKLSYGHIDLVDKFLNPHIYYELLRYKRNLNDLITGTNDFYFDTATKQLVEITPKTTVPEKVRRGTGLKFLYNIWDSIDFSEPVNCSPATAMRLKLFRNVKKNECFMTKLPVIPAFYRDVHSSSEKINEINSFYRKFITNAASLRATSGMFEMFGTTSSNKKIQEQLLELYSYFINLVGGSKGFIHKNVMGKTTDYSARAVISMPTYDKDTNEVDFMHSALPLSTACKCFAPFIKYGIRKIVERRLSGRNVIVTKNEKGELERLELATDFMDDFNSDNLDKLIELYDSSFDHRFDILKIRTKDGRKFPLLMITNEEHHTLDKGMVEDNDEAINGEMNGMNNITMEEAVKTERTGKISLHAATLTEIFYMAAYETCKDKTIYITRYPIEDQHNIYPSLFNIIPCINYKSRYVFNRFYPHFPVIPRDTKNQENLNYLFVDSLRVFPSYLKALGGDFDGDQVSIQGVFTEEANNAARKYITSNMNIMNASGGTMREFSEVCQIGNYMLTYRFPQE